MVRYTIYKTIILPDLDHKFKITTVFIFKFIYMQKTTIAVWMFPLMAYDFVYTTNTNCGTGTASLAERPSSTLVFSGVRIARSLVFRVKLCISWLILLSLFYLDIVMPVEKSLEIQRRRVNNTMDKRKCTKGQAT